MRKRLLSTLLALCMVLTFLSGAVLAASNPFSDVPESAYYAEPVAWAVSQGITNGTSAAMFSPDQDCTHGHIITFLYNAVGQPSTTKNNPYTNEKITEDKYYYSPMIWAHENGIVFDANLDPDTPCSRADTVTYIWRYCDCPSATPSGQFKDVPWHGFGMSVIPLAVSWAVENGITSGTSPNTFSPDKICTRAEVMTFLWRALVVQGTDRLDSDFIKTDITVNNSEVPFDLVDSTIHIGEEIRFTFDLSSYGAFLAPNVTVSSSDTSIVAITESSVSGSWSIDQNSCEGFATMRGGFLGTATIDIKASETVLMSKAITVESDMPSILSNGKEITDDNIREIIYGLRSQYPEGTPWNLETSYYSPTLGRNYTACDAFARLCSDAAFGNLPISDRHSDFDRIRVGDWLGYDNGKGSRHAVIVLEKRGNSVIVVEGNYNSIVHWGREVSRQQLEKDLVVETRYTVKN